MLKLNIPYGQNKLVKIYALSILDASAQTGNPPYPPHPKAPGQHKLVKYHAPSFPSSVIMRSIFAETLP